MRARRIALGTALLLAAACNGSGGGGGAAEPKSVWCDPATRLCWQNPQKDAFDAADQGLIHAEAARYCDELVWGGYDNWRLPSVAELRTLIRGSAGAAPGGDCGVAFGSGRFDGYNLACLGGEPFEGPGPGGCYWPEGLDGTCDKPDPAVVGHPLETWAREAAVDDPARWFAYVSFEAGSAGFNHACSLGDARCVRDDDGVAPLPCSVPGACRTEFAPDPAAAARCDRDLCGGADKLTLTVRVPRKLPGTPHQLLAFLYEAEDFQFPPLGPPDGGTDYNQVIDPEIDLDKPLTITIPGCTYYREELLAGKYRLYVELQQEPKFPPIPVDGDYLHGRTAAPISFPFDGAAHRGAERRLDVTLEPVACPPEAPARCPDGRCAAEAALCARTECAAVPDDSGVLACRYKSLFIDDNCADFPVEDGWTAAEVQAFCEGQQGADPATVAVTLGESCLVEKGGFAASARCAAFRSGRRWFGYGVPEFVCNLFVRGAYEAPGPFCEAY